MFQMQSKNLRLKNNVYDTAIININNNRFNIIYIRLDLLYKSEKYKQM